MARLNVDLKESVTLSLLTMVGASAFDSPNPHVSAIKRRMEEKFDVAISDEDIVNIITKVKTLIVRSGEEDVIIE